MSKKSKPRHMSSKDHKQKKKSNFEQVVSEKSFRKEDQLKFSAKLPVDSSASITAIPNLPAKPIKGIAEATNLITKNVVYDVKRIGIISVSLLSIMGILAIFIS